MKVLSILMALLLMHCQSNLSTKSNKKNCSKKGRKSRGKKDPKRKRILPTIDKNNQQPSSPYQSEEEENILFIDTPGSKEVQGIAVGATSACAIMRDHKVRCWIDEDEMEILGAIKLFDRPLLASSIVADDDQYCAITSFNDLKRAPTGVQNNGDIVCWNTNNTRQKPVHFSQTAAGAITIRDNFLCYKSFWIGQKTINCSKIEERKDSKLEQILLSKYSLNMEVAQVALGDSHICYTLKDTIQQSIPYCVGHNQNRQLGIKNNIAQNNSGNNLPVNHPKINPMSQIVAGDDFGCGISTNNNNRILCWGSGISKRTSNSGLPRLQKTKNVLHIAASRTAVCGTTQSTVTCNSKYPIDNLQKVNKRLPDGNITDIAVGSYGACVVLDNKVYCWGRECSWEPEAVRF